jgi:transcription initiation factor IIF auxiliary subunit
MQEYAPNFSEAVEGNIAAELVLDNNGDPIFKETGSKTHYSVKLRLVSNKMGSVKLVIYRLDPSYYNSVREAKDPTRSFEVELQTYGDYSFAVEVYLSGAVARQTFILSRLLQETHGGSVNPQIQKALRDIVSN